MLVGWWGLFTFWMVFQVPTQAQTHLVSADFPTIQAAINVAQVGGTVLVGPGTYFENLPLGGQNIVLTSRAMAVRFGRDL